MGGATYSPDAAGFKAMALSDEIRDAVRQIGEKGLAFAETISQDFRRTGDYADSFEVVEASVDISPSRPGRFRAAAILQNTSRHATAVEVGRGAHHVLARTLEFLEGPE